MDGRDVADLTLGDPLVFGVPTVFAGVDLTLGDPLTFGVPTAFVGVDFGDPLVFFIGVEGLL